MAFDRLLLKGLLTYLLTSASDLLMRTIKFCYVVFGVTSSLPVINNDAWRGGIC